MSDGYPLHEPTLSWEPATTGFEPAPAANDAPPRVRDDDLLRLADWLPRLGPVLWVHRGPRHPPHERACVTARGVMLIDHPALLALGRAVDLVAGSTVTPHGPREWLALRDAHGRVQAKLFLLPDTDYLAWDRMLADFGERLQREEAVAACSRWQAPISYLRGALTRLGAPWRAQLLTFSVQRLPWVQALGAQRPASLSALGRGLAEAIAADERADGLGAAAI